jgi:RHS repeat-associated protein
LSRRTQLTRPNGVNTNYNYDSVSHLLSVLHQAGSTTLDGAGYGYDFAGNRTSKTNYLNGITSNYGYDAIYELQQVTQANVTTESYSYDAVGNRLTSLGVNPYTYNASNELTATPSGSYTYDANGNTLTDASGKNYTWDFENRLVQAVVPGTGTVAFKYDPFGRRIQKSSPLGTTNYLYDGVAKGGSNVIEEVDNGANVLARYTQGQGSDQHLAELRSGTVSYYDQDALGSVTSLSTLAASLANTYTYDAFGKLITLTGTLTNPFLYTGREFDPEIGTYYYRARYYDQTIGRFVSEDPIRFAASSSFYVYTQNRPVNATDPTGLKLLYCSRGGFENSSPGGVGNHGYLYDTRNGHNCGRGGQNGLEDPTTPGTVCREVPGSDGHEDDVMRCCNSENKNPGQWFPWWNDCQTLAGNCLIMNNLPDPGAPGGRAGCRGKCQPPKHYETGPF